jgi:GPH family glycoside/pentoside/hexuronide:cation symporter
VDVGTAATEAGAESKAQQRLPTSLCIGFGIGSFGISILLNTTTVFFPAIMTTVLGQSAAVAGLLLTVSKLYDAFADVGIGIISDRVKSAKGRRRPFLLAGALLSAISFLLLFIPPKLSDGALIAWMAMALIVYSTGYSLFSVPYVAMAGEMADGYHERTRLLSFRAFFISFGQIAASAGTAALITWGGGGRLGYAIMGCAAATALFVTMSASFFGTAKARIVHATEKHNFSRREALATLASNRPFLLLMGVKLAQYIAISIISTTKLLFLLNVLKVGYVGLVNLTLVQNLVSAATVPIWVKVAKRIGKRPAYLLATATLGLVYISWYFTDESITSWGLWTRGAFNGVAASGTALLSVAMLPDVMEYDFRRTGLRREGIFSSVYTIIEKVGYALGPGIIGVLLARAHYLPTLQGKLVTQPASAISALYAGSSLIPACFIVVSLVLMWLYPLDEKLLARTTTLARS